MAKLIIADDEAILRVALKLNLEKLGHSVLFETYNGEQTIEKALNNTEVDTILLDISMDGRYDGINACSVIKKAKPDIKIFFISAYPESEFNDVLKKVDYDGYLEKPLNDYAMMEILK